MIEFNGWTIISESFNEEGKNEKLLKLIVNQIESKIAELEFDNEFYSLKCLNGAYHLSIMANHNHRSEHIIEFFKWIAEISKGSYGLLYVQDDEDVENENKFKVWSMKKGKVIESDDTFLTPRNPQVEE